MKFTSVAAVAALALTVSAQDLSAAPPCAMKCLSASSACKFGDFACMCTNTDFQDALQTCICTKECTTEKDQKAASALAASVCQAQGKPIADKYKNCPASGGHSSAAPPATSAAPATSAPAPTGGPAYGSSAPATSAAPATSEAPAASSSPSASGNGTAPQPTQTPGYTNGANTVVPGVLAFAGFVAALAL